MKGTGPGLLYTTVNGKGQLSVPVRLKEIIFTDVPACYLNEKEMTRQFVFLRLSIFFSTHRFKRTLQALWLSQYQFLVWVQFSSRSKGWLNEILV